MLDNFLFAYPIRYTVFSLITVLFCYLSVRFGSTMYLVTFIVMYIGIALYTNAIVVNNKLNKI